MMYSIIFLLATSVVVFYHVYRTVWFRVISLFETINSTRRTTSGATTPLSTSSLSLYNSKPGLYKSHSSQFFKLMVESDLDTSDLWIVTLKKVARVVFSLTITATVSIIQFILIQAIHKDQKVDGVELLIWELFLYSIVLSLVFVQPSIVTYLLVNKFFKSQLLNRHGVKFVTSALLIGLWLIFVLSFDSLTDFRGLMMDDGFATRLLYRISIIGITLIAILNGIGSFSTAYYYLYRDLFKKNDALNKDDNTIKQRLMDLRRSYENTDNLIKSKDGELISKIQANQGSLQQRTNIQPKGSFADLSNLFGKNTDNDSITDDVLQSEIKSLTLIKNDIFLKIQRLESYLENGGSSKNQQQKIIKTVQKVVAIYCFFKMLQVTAVKVVSFWSQYGTEALNAKESDPLVITLAKVVKLFLTFEDEDFLVNQLSFIVSGGLFLCSFNGVFMTLTHIYKFLPIDLSNLKTSNIRENKSVSIIKNLFISELLGIYVLATIFILRSNLTKSFSSKLNFLLNLNQDSNNVHDFQIIDNWFDKVFLISVVITATGIRISEILTIDEGFEDQELLNKVV